MAWTTCAERKCDVEGTCVVHEGKVVWLWHLDHNSAVYDPANDSWRKLSATNAATTHNGDHVWTGTELWLWGGASFSMKRGISRSFGGFAYHPAEDRWRALAGLPGDKEDSLNSR